MTALIVGDDRERIISSLYSPVGDIIKAADAVHRAATDADLGALARADRALQDRIADYLERVIA